MSDEARARWNATKRARRVADPEAARAADKASYERSKPAFLRAGAKWVAANPERRAAIVAAFNERHKDTVVEKRRAYIEANAEAVRAAKARWALANPEALRCKVRNRRAKAKLVGGVHTAGQIIELRLRQGHKCAGCGASIAVSYEVDHITPIKRGGSNDIGNIQLLCRPCNRRKSSKDPIVWARQNGRLL